MIQLASTTVVAAASVIMRLVANAGTAKKPGSIASVFADTRTTYHYHLRWIGLL
jgi:hypothetical protein